MLKIKAGALQLTLFISVVIALLLGAFILYIKLQDRIQKQHYFVQETINNAQKGIEYGLINKLTINDSIFVLDNDDESIKVKSSYWGMLTKITSKATIKNFSFKKVAFIGTQKDSEKNIVLQLADYNKPLVLVGKTNIQGNALLPKQGVKPGNIAGVPFYGANLIDGRISVGNQLPEFSLERKKYFNSIFSVPQAESDFIDLDTNRKWKNSFNNETKVIYSNSAIQLEAVDLLGNIKIQSATKITIKESANLKDILVVAPTIEIKENVVGTFQAIASKEIIVDKDVKLGYPSALVVSENNKEENKSSIQISNGVEINGAVVYLGKGKASNYDSQIYLDTDSKIIGEVYCNKNLELLGSVYGRVYTANFITRQSGSIYQNHIYNGTILIDKLPNEYVGLSFAKNTNKSLVKWLY
ncbi:hypothetical protein [Pseudofulvibacter geojedonensis]|uniref:Uncharacterized protein n=1 Tax=Pseudofulvibacter geojedonensis TaxID=1123758 RepID=A0ABW3I2M2_9FLAO